MKKKGNKKMFIPRQEIIDNPIPTSLFSINYLVRSGARRAEIILRLSNEDSNPCQRLLALINSYIFVFNKLSLHIYMCYYLSSNCIPSAYTQQNSCIAHKPRCRDGVINDLLSQYRHLLVPLLFHDVTSLHPPSFQRNDFSTCILAGQSLVAILHHYYNKSGKRWKNHFSEINGDVGMSCLEKEQE